jgi:phage-related protein
MKRTGLTTRHWLATLALTTLIWAAPGLAQSPSATPQNGTPPQNNLQNRQNGSWRFEELFNMDRFLDGHPEIAQQIRKDPSLVDNKQFVASHPALQQFLSEHASVRAACEKNPQEFMQDVTRFERTDEVTRRELMNMDRFLDAHPEIAQQLQKDPSLIDNQKFLGDHPALRQFLAEHPGVREAYERNPNLFMRDEDRFDHNGNRPDITRGELATMDQFLDRHPEIAEQLQKDPKLIDDNKWVANHPALQNFMADHPEVRQQFDEHPYAFMRDEDHFDQHGNPGMGRSPDMDHGQVASFHEFLQGHSSIAAELGKNPSLATNDEYLQNHSELQSYLKDNPEVKTQLSSNPQAFVKSSQDFDATTGTTAKSMTKVPAVK